MGLCFGQGWFYTGPIKAVTLGSRDLRWRAVDTPTNWRCFF